ncbi:MAG: sulfotransferase [Planctomycetes bacterium]|nr:sulfotransferase [Planctomycetota bacterium]
MKLVSQLLYDLPEGERYRVVFMERDLDEVPVSQEVMLARRGHPAVSRAEMRAAFADHIARLRTWLAARDDVAVRYVSFRELVAPRGAARVAEFVGVPLAADACAAVDPVLYRNRSAGIA